MLRLEYFIGCDTKKMDLKKPVLKVEMEYLPTLSVNRYKTVRGIIRNEVRQWMDELTLIIRCVVNAKEPEFTPPLKVRLDAVFKDNRHPDLSNLWKVVCDAVKEGIGIDDKHFRIEDGDIELGETPKLIITISNIKLREG